MPSRLAVWTLLAVAGFGRPCLAQKEKVVSAHPPLSPSDAVSVLRSSHSLADMANRPLIDGDGPRVYILPYDQSVDVPPPNPPIEPLARDLMPFPYGVDYGYGSGVPYGGYGYGYGGAYAPYRAYAPFGSHVPFNGFVNTPQPFPIGQTRPFVASPRVPPQPPPQPFRHNVTGTTSAGAPVRPR
jgi:hypothetical protein